MVQPMRIELGHVAVHHGVEVVGDRRAGRVLVLDVVGGREIHDLRPVALHQLDAGGEHELRQAGAVDVRHVHADQGVDVLDAVLGQGRLVGFLRGEAAGLAGAQLQPLPRRPRSLSLAVMTAMRQPARWKAGNSVSTRRNFGSFIITSLPAVGIEEVVAANAVHGGRLAGDDGEVVGVGEAGHDAVGQQAGALRQHLAEPRRAAGLDGALDVAGLRAVDADHDDGLLGQAIAAAVDGDLAAEWC